MNNVGTDQIKNLIWGHLKRSGFKGGMRFSKFADDTANEIWKLIFGDDDVDVEWKIASNFPEELNPLVDRLEKGLKLGMMKRNSRAEPIYRWMLKQDANGFPISAFIAWATDEKNIQYVSKYAKNPEWLKVDYPRAFNESKVKIAVNGDGSLYV